MGVDADDAIGSIQARATCASVAHHETLSRKGVGHRTEECRDPLARFAGRPRALEGKAAHRPFRIGLPRADDPVGSAERLLQPRCGRSERPSGKRCDPHAAR